MTPDERREYGKAWRASHPGYLTAYHRARPRDARWQAWADRPCRVEGCPEPRYVSPAGFVDTRCRKHAAEESRERYRASHPPKPRPLRPCRDCDQPRVRLPNGERDERCAAHSDRLASLRHHLDPLGLALDQFAAILDRQGQRCAACRRRRPYALTSWTFDPDRGALLCGRCQRAIAAMRGDPSAAAGVAAYLASECLAGAAG